MNGKPRCPYSRIIIRRRRDVFCRKEHKEHRGGGRYFALFAAKKGNEKCANVETANANIQQPISFQVWETGGWLLVGRCIWAAVPPCHVNGGE